MPVTDIGDFVLGDVEEARAKADKPLDVNKGPFRNDMNVVGDLFGSGKMFFLEVNKSAPH